MANETAPLVEEITPAAGATASAAAAEGDAKHELLPELMANLLEDVPESQKPSGVVAAEEKKKKDAEKAEETRLAAEKLDKEKKDKEVVKPITARRDKVKRPDLPIEQPVEKREAPAARQAAAAEPENDSDLEEEEKQMIADAEEAEKLLPGKHIGLKDKVRKFVRDNIQFIKTHGGDESFDDQSPEYQAFLAKNQPRLSPADVREINETRIENRVTERTRPEIDKIRDQHFADIEQPKIDAVAQEAYRRIAPTVTPKAILDAIAEETVAAGGNRDEGYKKAYAYYKPELDVIHSVLTEVKSDVREFERITRINKETGRPLVAVATDPRDPKYAHHQRLAELVRYECDEFKKSAPQAEQIRDGRWFVTKDEWFKIRPEARGQFWTFTNKEILDRSLRRVPAFVNSEIKKKLDGIAAQGFTRPPRVSSKKAEVVVPARGAPAARHPTPVPAAGSGEGVKSEGARLAATLAEAG